LAVREAQARAALQFGIDFSNMDFRAAYESFLKDFMFEVIATYENAGQRMVRFHVDVVRDVYTGRQTQSEQAFRDHFLGFFFDHNKQLYKLSCCIYKSLDFFPCGIPKWFCGCNRKFYPQQDTVGSDMM
jgi:hypothetical protein